jgi:hypothetical protein
MGIFKELNISPSFLLSSKHTEEGTEERIHEPGLVDIATFASTLSSIQVKI